MASEEPGIVTKRLHIAGLTPQFSKEALRERLSSYGEVLALDGCTDDWVDGVGARRPYAFATLAATPAQLARCMNTLSGAIWKGAKLRVGEARPPWNERSARARAEDAGAGDPAERARQARVKWLRRRPWIGMHAHDMRPVTPDMVDGGAWGWKRTPAGHLVRPMHMRLSRPIPRPRHSERAPKRSHTVRRAPRLTIDPTRYEREHLTGALLEALPDTAGTLRWAWDDDAREWLGYDDSGACVAREPAPRDARAAHAAAAASHARDAAREAPRSPLSPLAADALDELDVSDAEAPPDTLFDAPPAPSGAWWTDDDDAQDAAAPSAAPASQWWADDDDGDGAAAPAQPAAPKPASPAREAPDAHAPRTRPPTPPQAQGSRLPRATLAADILDDEFSDGYEEQDTHAPALSSTAETSRALGLLASLLGDDAADDAPEARVVSLDADDAAAAPRDDHAAAAASPETDEPPAARADAHASPERDAAAPRPEATAPAAAAAHDSRADAVNMTTLQDMFQPTETDGGFTLFGALAEDDVDWDVVHAMDLDGAAAAAAAPASAAAAPEHAAAAVAATSALPVMTTPWTHASSKTLLPALLQRGAAPFWQVDTDEEVEGRWRAGRAEMTQLYRRLHREAVKKRRRKVVGARASAAEGGLAPARGAVDRDAPAT